ncbi:DUF292-domain-containing protein [Amniculicola lignicola CBS 123094]|uniref:DUF292-domain-containing protein n=1 Tax=Amniculicola lignicola CBS 123094 TaxID=1392246 RepID=A0A6A5WKT1_9PLEO|nr:DUF292-domain-containing protein [Amniculicola lignicola CBS 123094]
MQNRKSLANQLKVQLKLSVSRLRMVQQKDTAKAKQQRREMAQLLEAGKTQSAKIRVENIIRSDLQTEVHEILELYCELLLARSFFFEQPTSPHSASSTTPNIELDEALEEAVHSIIYAAPRTEVKELHNTRGLLIDRFGKDVAAQAMDGEKVADRVRNKLKLETPKAELVDAYLTEIARFYGVPYGPATPPSDDEDDDDEDPSTGLAEEIPPELEPALEAERTVPPPIDTDADPKKQREQEEREELVKATPPKKFGPQSPLRITPPNPSTDNIAPKLKLPGSVGTGKGKVVPEAKKGKKEDGPGGKIPDVDELAKRFAMLKR